MDRLSYWIYRLIYAVAAWLPLPLLCRLGMAGGWCAYYLLPGYRRLALHNLEIAFGTPLAERRALARRHFMTLGGNLLGSLGVARMTADEVRTVAEVEGLEIAQRLRAAGQGFVFVIAHLGNWELLSQLTPLVLGGSLGTIYQRLGNRFIDADVRASRARLGLQLFERKEGFQGALKVLREAGGVGVLADQHAGDAGVWAPFFGRLASTTSLPAMMALRTGAALLPITIYTVRPGRWRWVIGEPIPIQTRDVNQLTAAINLNLEERIRAAPADWFWVHNRWKTPKPKFLLSTYKRGVVAPVDNRPLKPFRILIRSTNWLGDAVMSVPAVRAIKAGRPDAHVTVLAPAKLVGIWQTVPEVDEVIAIQKRDSVFGVARNLAARRFDAAILFPNSVRAALEAWLAGIPRRVGFPGHRRAWLLNQPFREKKKKLTRPPAHQVEHYLRLAEFVGAETDCWRLAEPRPPHTASVARIAVCPGAEYGPAKRWPPDRFAQVIRQVSTGRPCEWWIVGVEKDAPIAEEITRACTGVDVRNAAGKTSLAELIALLRTCTLLLTNDTGTMHLATLLGVPVVAIFGSTEPALTGPLGEGHRVLRHHVDCSPCFLRECPLDFRCMKAVEPGEAAAAIDGMLPARLAVGA